LAEIDIHAAQISALAWDVQDVPGLRVDGALGAPVGEVGVDEDVHDAPGMSRERTDVLAPDRLAHAAARAVAPDDVLRADRPLDGVLPNAHLDGVLPLVRDGE